MAEPDSNSQEPSFINPAISHPFLVDWLIFFRRVETTNRTSNKYHRSLQMGNHEIIVGLFISYKLSNQKPISIDKDVQHQLFYVGVTNDGFRTIPTNLIMCNSTSAAGVLGLVARRKGAQLAQLAARSRQNYSRVRRKSSITSDWLWFSGRLFF